MHKIHKSQVIGLPPHAQMQYMAGVPRIYFQYAYTIDGKKYTERDYLGVADELTLEFVPNAYFMREKPVFERRPIHHYKNEKKRILEIERRNKELLSRKSEILKNAESKVEPAAANEGEAVESNSEVDIDAVEAPNLITRQDGVKTGLPTAAALVKAELVATADNKEAATNKEAPIASINKVEIVELEAPADVLGLDETKQAGASAVAIEILLQIGMIEDLYYHVFDRDIKDTVKLVNLAVHAATTALPTYNAGIVSYSQLFIGGKCLCPPRASEFYQRIGADRTVNKKISRARLKRVGQEGLISIGGTKIPCYSKNIPIAAIGKDKKGGFSPQISYSMLAHIPTGQAVGYEYYGGNIPDISSLKLHFDQWDTIGIKYTDVTFVMDRGHYSKEAVVEMCEGGVNFIVGMKTNVKVVDDIIVNKNYEFREPTRLLDTANYYGLKSPWAASYKGYTANIDVFVYRNPVKTMEENRKLKEDLKEFKAKWDSGDCDTENDLVTLCKNPVVGHKITIDWKAYSQRCYLQGFFAMASNVKGLTLEMALKDYSTRNEVEVIFGLMFHHLLKSTRVHSLAALDGLLLAVFVALNILGVLRHRMASKLPESWKGRTADPTVKKRFSIAEMLWHFNHISLGRASNGKLRLTGNTEKLKDLAGAIGMKGLFDSPERTAKLFSPSYLERIIGAK